VPATASHIEELIATMKREDVRLVIREVAYELPLAETVARKAGARVATVATLTGGLPGADTYVAFIQANLDAVLAALPPAGAE
jgi:ABC-type Zn uptake system ZnuABC Zn-binding protein ZnuA